MPSLFKDEIYKILAADNCFFKEIYSSFLILYLKSASICTQLKAGSPRIAFALMFTKEKMFP